MLAQRVALVKLLHRRPYRRWELDALLATVKSKHLENEMYGRCCHRDCCRAILDTTCVDTQHLNSGNIWACSSVLITIRPRPDYVVPADATTLQSTAVKSKFRKSAASAPLPADPVAPSIFKRPAPRHRTLLRRRQDFKTEVYHEHCVLRPKYRQHVRHPRITRERYTTCPLFRCHICLGNGIITQTSNEQ